MDFIAGILILYMIMVHLSQNIGIYNGRVLFYMQFLNFYMPWFFYKGGQYFKINEFKNLFAYGTKRLIYPYIKYSIIGYLVYCVCLLLKGDYNWIHYILTPIKSFLLSGSIPGNEPLWFLLTLFVVRLFAYYIIKWERFLLFFIILCFLLGFTMNILHIYKPDYFLNTITGLGFFLTGYKFRNCKYATNITLLCFGTYLLLYVFCFSSVEMRHNILERGHYLLWPLCCIVGIRFVNGFAYNVRFNKYNLIVIIGRNSLLFLVWHWPIIQLIGIFI